MTLEKLTVFSIGRPKLLIALTVIITMLFFFQFPRIHIDTDPENMLEETQPDRVFYNEIEGVFRIRDLLVVGITDPQGIFRTDALERVDRIIAEILEIDGVIIQDVVSLTSSNNPISEGQSEILFDRVMREVPPTDPASAQLFREVSSNWCLEDRLVSRDGKSIAIYIPIARKDMSRRIGEQIEAILHEQLFPGQSYHFAGLPIAVCSTLTLGIAIDFAIHYNQRWRTHFRTSQNIEATHRFMFGEPALAILRNAIVISLGFLPLTLSHLTPYITVGTFFALLTMISTVVTLVLLPAMVRHLAQRPLRNESRNKVMQHA